MADKPEVQEGEVIFSVEKFHVQVRMEDGGPKKPDGRRGQIVIEDFSAPYDVVRWLRSPKCGKSVKTAKGGRNCYVWINDEMLANVSEHVPDENRDPPAPPMPAILADAQVAAAYQARLEDLSRRLEDDVQRARKARDEEVAACTRQIDEIHRLVEAARKRLSAELEREDAEIAALAERRAAMTQQRLSMAASIVETETQIHEGITRHLATKQDGLLADAQTFLSTKPGALIGMAVAQKLGLPPELVMMFGGIEPPDAAAQAPPAPPAGENPGK